MKKKFKFETWHFILIVIGIILMVQGKGMFMGAIAPWEFEDPCIETGGEWDSETHICTCPERTSVWGNGYCYNKNPEIACEELGGTVINRWESEEPIPGPQWSWFKCEKKGEDITSEAYENTIANGQITTSPEEIELCESTGGRIEPQSGGGYACICPSEDMEYGHFNSIKGCILCDDMVFPDVMPPEGYMYVYDYDEEGCTIGRHEELIPFHCTTDEDCKEQFQICFATCYNNLCVFPVCLPPPPCEGAIWLGYPTCEFDTTQCLVEYCYGGAPFHCEEVISYGVGWCESEVFDSLEECEEIIGMQTGMPDPSCVFCLEQGGTLEIRTEEAGQYGVCIFPGGTECGTWQYYNKCHPEKVWVGADIACDYPCIGKPGLPWKLILIIGGILLISYLIFEIDIGGKKRGFIKR